MSIITPSLQALIQKLTILPGVGPKSAQRMAIYLLQKKRSETHQLTQCMMDCLEKVQHCQRCRNFCEQTFCPICENPKREQNILCVVESIADLMTIEQTGIYQGLYFVLMGHLSPIDRIGPEELGIPKLLSMVDEQGFEEVILATNPTIEGEITASYITEYLPKHIRATRLATGVPVGSELEHLNDNTLHLALTQRKLMADDPA